MSSMLVLDYDNGFLVSRLGMEPSLFWNSKLYKLRLRRYIERDLCSDEIIIFKNHLTYPVFKKIIKMIERDADTRDYNFHVTDKLKSYIEQRELYINKRANIGLAIKNQSDEITDRFLEYKSVVDRMMVRKLREKQAWDSFFMYTMRKAANFSVPGSGKTSSVLGVYSYLSSRGLVDKIVMIGPKNSFGSWIDEFYNCFGTKDDLNIFSIQDYKLLRDKKNALMYSTKGKNMLLFNYESLESIIREVKLLIDNKTLLVFDEVHKIKGFNGVRANNALEISKDSYYTIAMSGTPIPNSYLDIRNLLSMLYHDEYEEFFGFTTSQLKDPTENDISEINSKIQPFFCRTTKKQLEVPDANPDIIIEKDASKIENEIYNILLLKYSNNKLALIIRLLQLESNPKMILRAIDHNGEDFSDILDTSGEVDDYEYKDYSDEIVELINSVDKTSKFQNCIDLAMDLTQKGESIIIWCIFVDSINSLASALQSRGVRVGIIYGSTNDIERQRIINQFRNTEIEVLITNPHTLAESVSLHSVCHNAIYFEYSYNLVHLLQSKDRIHRLGLPKDQYTQYYFIQNNFLTRDYERYSLDLRIYERLLYKERIMLEAIENDILENPSTLEDDIKFLFDNLKI